MAAVGTEATPGAITIADVENELQQAGASLESLVITDSDAKGNPITRTLKSPPRETSLNPGDTLYYVKDGVTYMTHVNEAANDLETPTVFKGTPKTAPNIQLPSSGTPLERATAIRDQIVSRYNDPNTPDSEKAGLLTLLQQQETQINSLSKTQTKMDPNDPVTQAMAKTAAAEMAAGKEPSSEYVTAYFAVNGGKASGQPSQYTMPIPGYTWALQPHHAGNENGAVDLFAPPGTPIVAAAGGTVVRAGPYGAAGNDIYIQGNDGRVYDYEHTDNLKVQPGDVVQAGQPLAVVATLENGGSSVGPATHLHFAVGAKDGSINYDDHGTSTDFDTLGFLKGISSGQQPGGSGTNPFAAKPEYHALGDKIYRANPDGSFSVVVDASGEKAPTTHQLGNILYQYDPATQQWKQAIVGPQTADQIKAQQDQQGQVQTVLQQMQNTKDFIQQQFAAGKLTPQEAAQYQQSLLDYTNAALQGTTPYDLWKTQQEQTTQRSQIAKDLLDEKVSQTTSMVDNLLGDTMRSVAASKY
ncbi:MAG TPA: M23 family metallopeptidase, partial [Arthrobacter sp.]|nr:M23 family metallopeptidase [Arthrobacter sp.]